jgi:hypothetical protein
MLKLLLTFVLLTTVVNSTSAWKYQTKCTRHIGSPNVGKKDPSSSIVDDFDKDDEYDNFATRIPSLLTPTAVSENDEDKLLRLKCPNINDFLFIGLTQYGVSNSSSVNNPKQCTINPSDCLISVDYIASQCNGLNTCDIQLDAQFLHSCKNHSDYISVAYECIPGSKRMDVCSNDETFIIDSSSKQQDSAAPLNNRFGSFYLASPGYPNEYANNLNNCSCQLEYVKIDTTGQTEQQQQQQQKLDTESINLRFKSYEFDLEEDEESGQTSSEDATATNSLRRERCTKDSLKIESIVDENGSSASSSVSLCGQYRDFKEFYAKGSRFNFNFNTDDAITRRGFLLKVEPTPGKSTKTVFFL